MKKTSFNWDDVFKTGPIAREAERMATEREPVKHPWKHRISRKVMIDVLVAEGIVWAGWYKPRTLQAKYGEVFGRCFRGSFGPQRHVLYGTKR